MVLLFCMTGLLRLLLIGDLSKKSLHPVRLTPPISRNCTDI